MQFTEKIVKTPRNVENQRYLIETTIKLAGEEYLLNLPCQIELKYAQCDSFGEEKTLKIDSLVMWIGNLARESTRIHS